MHNINLTHKNLSNQTFKEIDFSDSTFNDADLSNSTFIDCLFKETYGDHTNMRNSKFIRCTMREAIFLYADTSNATFQDCNMYRINFKKSRMHYTKFTGETTLRMSNFRGADLIEAEFGLEVIIAGIQWRNAHLLGSKGLSKYMIQANHKFDIAEDDEKLYMFKLIDHNWGGPFHGGIKYEIGGTYTEDRRPHVEETDPWALHGPGLAVADLDWVIREWVATGMSFDWHLLKVSFYKKDIKVKPYNKDGKMQLHKMTIEKEIKFEDLGFVRPEIRLHHGDYA